MNAVKQRAPLQKLLSVCKFALVFSAFISPAGAELIAIDPTDPTEHIPYITAVVCSSKSCSQSSALKLSLANSYNITGIQGYLTGIGGGGLTLALYSEVNGLPGDELYSSVFSVSDLTSSQGSEWAGASNVSWSVSPGDYWASFEVRSGQTYSGGLRIFTAFPLAVKNESFPQWTLFGSGNGAGDGLVVSGNMVSPIPVPAAAWLFGSALMSVGGIARQKRRPITTQA